MRPSTVVYVYRQMSVVEISTKILQQKTSIISLGFVKIIKVLARISMSEILCNVL